jgi:ABC-2 type transport system ATP-binding protein
MQGDLLEMICTPQREARGLLQGLPGVKSVQAFGERLHVWLEDAERFQPGVEAALKTSGIITEHLRRVPPTLEDVFVSMILAEEEAQPA